MKRFLIHLASLKESGLIPADMYSFIHTQAINADLAGEFGFETEAIQHQDIVEYQLGSLLQKSYHKDLDFLVALLPKNRSQNTITIPSINLN